SCTLLPVPSFTEYEDACSLYGHRLVFLPRTDVSALPAGELMFICNPNNPDGRIWTLDDICRILEGCPDRVLVVDESFIGFAPEAQTAVGLLKKYANLLVVRSMTKCYAIPGLRLGYLLGGEQLIERVGRFALPWSVNALAIEAGKFLLEQGASGLPDAVGLLQRQREFSGRIAQIPGFRPTPSHTSFFLTETDYDSSALKTYLLEHYSLLIRDASNFRGLDNHYFRVNTLTDEKNAMLTDALEAYARIQGEARRMKYDV
ncbi:MAG: aminotransferase class I/II-fold pyridoxal phosphate-dependent enzyme, partial [Odoribacter sp.]|nr:aminotransferase class I/II-fold pyridoxal phosphate-dependent enzyme [Odoribacter sp.]